ncbi:3'-5' exoribonuclease 1-like [Cloeon dipterum]|uniref:3'-5' exoribonuclease 1-like n=1 Tax=Cloeon dipterum TaxID=197152 RepID=UPI00322091DC
MATCIEEPALNGGTQNANFKGDPFASRMDHKKVARINHDINNLNLQEVKLRLQHRGSDAQGSVEVLRKRLKNLMVPINKLDNRSQMQYYVVIDFEATCEEEKNNNYPHEIIEFPALLIDTKKREIVDQFHMYCKPEVNPTLSEFCTKLTGISQEHVDSAEPFGVVVSKFHDWLLSHKLVGNKRKTNFAFVTDGPSDFSKFFIGNCKLANVHLPPYCRKYINIQRAFMAHYRCKKPSLNGMLEHLALKFEGRPHAGIDDAKNIARILLVLISEQAVLLPNERYSASGNVYHI